MRTKMARTGNSQSVIVPAPIIAEKGWEVGDALEIESIPSGIVIRSLPRRSFVATAKRVIKDRRDLLRELAKR